MNVCQLGENYISECALGYSNYGNRDLNYEVREGQRRFDVCWGRGRWWVRRELSEI
ncbi:MAG: hypothetical protein Harvfovirus26_19, partial [Harvfovirus sp.]